MIQNPLVTTPSWSEWNAWSSCSQSCGGGRRTRDRECEDKAISSATTRKLRNNFQSQCTGDFQETRSCGDVPCQGGVLILSYLYLRVKKQILSFSSNCPHVSCLSFWPYKWNMAHMIWVISLHSAIMVIDDSFCNLFFQLKPRSIG